MTLRRTLAAVAAVLAVAPFAAADEKTHKKAAEQLLVTLRVEKAMLETIDPMIDTLIKTNPAVGTYRTALKEYLKRQLSWEVQKEEWIAAYVEEFTEPELLDLAKFYQTPLGQKALDKQPKLTGRVMDFAVKKALANKEDLRKAIEAEAKKN
jgi:uncharacterized protein